MKTSMHIGGWFLFAALLSVPLGCLDEIDLETQPSEPLLAINGAVTTNPPPYEVTVRTNGQFAGGAEGTETPVLGAEVRILEFEGEQLLLTQTVFEVDPGLYQTPPVSPLRGTPGRTYVLEVTLPDGRRYRSTPEPLLPVPPIDSLGFTTRNEDILNASGNIQTRKIITPWVSTTFTPQTAQHLRWRLEGEYEFHELGTNTNPFPDICYVREAIDFENVVIANAAEINGPQLKKLPLLSRAVDYKFNDRYCFHVYQLSISEAAWKFWQAVQNEFERKGSIFETPPAVFRGNIHNVDDPFEEVLGLFSASAIDTMRLFVKPDAVGNPLPFCRFFTRDEPPCIDCTVLPKSSLQRPDYWE